MDHSAGGHLALLAGGEVPALAQGIGLSAITDIKAYFAGNNRDQKVTADFMQGSVLQKLAQYTLANPSEQPQDVNRYLLQGALDIIVPAKVWARCVVARSGAL
jgi:hypothetical protein